MLSVFIIFLTAILCFVSYMFYRYLLSPWLNLQYYKKQGASTDFYWELVSYPTFYKDALETGYFYNHYRQVITKNPDTRFIAENLGPNTYITLFDLNMIKHMLQKHEIYQRDRSFAVLIKVLSGGNVFLAEENEWKKRRRIISATFSFELLKDMIPVIAETTEEKFNDLIKNDKLKDLDLMHPLCDIAGDITGILFFGHRFKGYNINGESLTVSIQKLFGICMQEGFSPLSMLFGPNFPTWGILARHRKFKEDVRAVRTCCQQILDSIKSNPDKENNFINMVLKNRKEHNDLDGYTDQEVLGEFIGFFAAGTDTTARLVTTTLYYLCRNPDVLDKLKREAENIFSDPGKLTIESLNKLSYMEAVFKETFRIAGPTDVLFPRIVVEDDVIEGITIKKGTRVNACPAVLQNLERYFHNPETFEPERWLVKDQNIKDKGVSEPYAFLPFSAGPRSCVAQQFAMIESKIMLGLALKRFEFESPKDYKLVMILKAFYEPLEPLTFTLIPK